MLRHLSTRPTSLKKAVYWKKAEDLFNIRELRNQIAHDYVAEDINSLFEDVLLYTPKLRDVADSLKKYYLNLRLA